MEFIICNEKGEEITLLTDGQYIDMEIGEGNTFSIKISKEYQKRWGIDSGWRIGCPGKEYGGIIDKIVSTDNVLTISGATWRGMLTKKILQPPSGDDYLSVSGDADKIIDETICSQFDGIFVCNTTSGVEYSEFKFDRYVDSLAGIEKMLLSKNLRLSIEYDSGKANESSFVRIRSTPIHDFSDEIEYSKDGTLSYIYFAFEKFTGGINHLICLGKGELKDRLVLHLYADADGNISDKQSFFGKDERVTVYDYSNASSEEELREKGTERLKELLSYKSMDMDLFNESLAGLRGVNDDISIGDIVGGRDFDTGIYLSKQITRKIVQVKNGKESIEYSVGKPVLNRTTANSPVEQSNPLDKLIKTTADETGLSIGKDAELNKTFDIGLQTYLREKLLIEFNKFIFMKTSDGTSLGVMGMANNNELTIGWDGYDASIGATYVYGNKVNVITKNGLYTNGMVDAGGKASMFSDGEGGQFRIYSPNDVEWSMDAHDDNFRLYKIKDGTYYCPVYIDSNNDMQVNDLWADASSKETHIGFLHSGQYGTYLYAKPKGSDIRIGLYDNIGAGSLWYVASSDNNMYHGRLNVFSANVEIPHGKRIYFGLDGYIYCSGGQSMYIAASKETAYSVYLGVWDNAWTLCPNNDAHLRLGSPSCRWGNIYSTNATISTSDRNLKKDIQPLTDKHLKFFTMLQPVSFKFIDGTSGRTHIGFISQDVEEAMTACGLTDLDFAGFCKDKKTERVEKIIEVKKEVPKEMIDETTGETYIGTEIVVEEQTIEEDVSIEGEYIYSLRYEEFIALNTYVIQKQQSEIEMLKDEIAKIKSAIGL